MKYTIAIVAAALMVQVSSAQEITEVKLLNGRLMRSPCKQNAILQPPVEVRPGTVSVGNSNGNGGSATISQTVINQINEQLSVLQQQIDGLKQRPGVPGAPGRDGQDGLAGAAGKDGAAGRDGKDGAQGPAGVGPSDAQLQTIVAAYLTAHKSEFKGADGKNGADGKPGSDGTDGKDALTDVLTPNPDGSYDKLPPFYFKVVDPRGLWSTNSIPVHLGEQLNLRLSPTSGPGVEAPPTIESAPRDMPAPQKTNSNQTGQPQQSSDGGAT